METEYDYKVNSPLDEYSDDGSSKLKRILKIVIPVAIFVIVGVVAGYFIFQRLKSTKTVESNVLFATVGDRKIYTNDVQDIALEQYGKESIDNKIISVFKNIAIERAILDIEAEKLKINISDSQIKERKIGQLMQKGDNDIKYELIKEKIMESQVKTVSAFTIGFWIASFDYEQKPEYSIQRSQGKLALTDIEQRMKKNEQPSEIASYVARTYPELKEKIGVNGYIYIQKNDLNVINNPRNYTLNPKDLGKTYNDDELQKAMSKMRVGEIQRVERSDGSGGNVVKVISVSNGSYATYDDFINTRKRELLKLE